MTDPSWQFDVTYKLKKPLYEPYDRSEIAIRRSLWIKKPLSKPNDRAELVIRHFYGNTTHQAL